MTEENERAIRGGQMQPYASQVAHRTAGAAHRTLRLTPSDVLQVRRSGGPVLLVE